MPNGPIMEEILRIDTVRNYNDYIGVDTLHPLVSIINFSEVPKVVNFRMFMSVYAVFLKNIKCGNMIYGCQPYDYEDGTLVFVSPGQVYGIDSNGVAMVPSGYAMVFHPDLIKCTDLGRKIKEYTFFSYAIREALHLSKKERDAIVECLNKIAGELELNIDKHSKTLIASNIELLLNYCMRYYDRQFITRSNVNKDILVQFERLLEDYFASNKGRELGTPSVAYCGEQLHLSANYFGDLIKKETGSTALDYIQNRTIDEAKTRLFDTTKTINDVSFDLGFKYQQHFTRLFKQKTGMTPFEYRHAN